MCTVPDIKARAATETDEVPTAQAVEKSDVVRSLYGLRRKRGQLSSWAAYDLIPQGPRLGFQPTLHLPAFALCIPSA